MIIFAFWRWWPCSFCYCCANIPGWSLLRMLGCCLKHGLSAWGCWRAAWRMGSVIPGCASCLGDAAAGYQRYLPPNIVAMISPALVVLAILSQYVRQPKLKDKADEQQESQ
jgi:hypothetical protein